jgi:hypothetical protein
VLLSGFVLLGAGEVTAERGVVVVGVVVRPGFEMLPSGSKAR